MYSLVCVCVQDLKVLGAAEVASDTQNMPLCLSLDWSKAEE